MCARNHPKRNKLHWLAVWLIQFAAMLALSLAMALGMLLGGTIYRLLIWGLYPALGCLSAFAATRSGLNNYLAWLAPPTMLLCGNLIVWSYPLTVGPVLLSAFVSLAGAAAGEVIKQQTRK